MQFRIVTLHCAWQPSNHRLEHVFRLVCRTSLADCVAWERGGCAETRAVANIVLLVFIAWFSHPRQSLQVCKNSHGRRPTAGAQLIPATSTAHPTFQPQPQPPFYQAQVNTQENVRECACRCD